ncbi:MAG: type II toxin-antitoxin system VapC family toxin [Coriobacteriia bacterium]|nr:type II toxin-antitoxin system VapC family toxin [Coriobacteriia bacterium]
MSSRRPVFVLDASVGVKWFKPEAGQETALRLIERAAQGEISLATPTHCVHEILSVVRRHYTTRDIVPAWERLKASGIAVFPLTGEVVAEAARQCETLDCSFYDALAPACASLLGATLASADERAHGAYPGVHLVSSA